MAIYDMSDFSNTKKWLKNKNRQVSFFCYVYKVLSEDVQKKEPLLFLLL